MQLIIRTILAIFLTGTSAYSQNITPVTGGVLYAKSFGAKFDGVTDDAASLRLAITAAIQQGAQLILPLGTAATHSRLLFDCSLISGSKAFAIVGAGRYLTRLQKTISFSTNTILEFDNCPLGMSVSGFGIDGAYGTFGDTLSDLIFYNSSNVFTDDLDAVGFSNTGILAYQAPSGTNSNVVINNATVDGGGVGSAGVLIDAMINSGMQRIFAKNVLGVSPGYALQLKDISTYAWIRDSYAENSGACIAFGQQIGVTAVQNTLVSGVRCKNNTTGIITGYAQGDEISDVLLDMGTSTGNGIDLQNSVGLSLHGVVVIGGNHGASILKIRNGSTDNQIDIAQIERDASLINAQTVIFDSGSDRNLVTFHQTEYFGTATDLTPYVTNNGGSNNFAAFSPNGLYRDGVVTAPTIGFAAEPTTGLYRSGAGAPRLSVLGADLLRLGTNTVNPGNDGSVNLGAATFRYNNIRAYYYNVYGNIPNLSYEYQAPISGNTVGYANGIMFEVLNPAGTLATLTITLPACTSGTNGYAAGFSSTKAVTTLTVGTAGGSVAGAPASLTAGGSGGKMMFICRGSDTTWYPGPG